MTFLPSQADEQISGCKISDFIMSAPGAERAKDFFALIEQLSPDQIYVQSSVEIIFGSAVREKRDLIAKNRSGEQERRFDFLTRLLSVCHKFQKIPAQPGSGKTFWKNFFIQLIQ